MSVKITCLGRAVWTPAICAVVVSLAGARADSIPTPGCTAETFMDTSSGLDSSLDWGLTYAMAEIEQPGWHVFRARALAASGFGINPVPQTKTYIIGSAPGADVYSDSFAKGINVLAWTPMSDTLPASTPIVARYSVDLQGIIQSYGNNVRATKASLDLSLTVYDPATGPVAYLGGTASIERTYPPVEFIATGDLAGRFNWDGENDPTADVDTQFTVTFNAETCSTYVIEVILTSGLHTGALPESTSSSDFYDSCTYRFTGAFDPADVDFTTPLDVHMVTIPEPTTLVLLGMGGRVLPASV